MTTLVTPHIYLRYQPTTDPMRKTYPELCSKRDVVAYRSKKDADNGVEWFRYDWWKSKPTKRRAMVHVNYGIYKVIWLEDLNENTK